MDVTMETRIIIIQTNETRMDVHEAPASFTLFLSPKPAFNSIFGKTPLLKAQAGIWKAGSL